MSNLIDTHFHLDCCKNHAQLYEQINREKQYTLCVTNTPEAFERCIKAYPETKYVKFALGYNPQVVAEAKFNSFLFMKNLSKTRYIGEVGLDFSPHLVKYKEEQLKIFNFICKVSNINNKILTIHSRKAEREVLNILTNNNLQKVIMHWYTGDVKLINEFVKIGCFFSVNESMLKNRKGKELIKSIPKERILIESDIPFCNRENFNLENVYMGVEPILSRKEILNNFKTLII